MSQRKYALELIFEMGLAGSISAGIPLESNVKLTSEEYDSFIKGDSDPEATKDDNLLADPGQYQRLIERVVRYIKAAPGLGLLMLSDSSGTLVAYCDSDWGGCLQTRRSLMGYLVKFGEATISWKSKKQDTVARSSAEAEFRSMASTVVQCMINI
ncbi:PREDICTED: uncharacterized protein LOC109220210 [Nicotiana attenuata]|uniref:uncharacterized protein LOC109220210 n=1 Tax=Nicotiana attenuata TaxID=49451 RepID=UPI000905A918|nr:PREDICTED: uncharacterized protein LOC109220210 [Nicotiana attenuata]